MVHEAKLAETAPGGTTAEDHLAYRARHGSPGAGQAFARQELQGPEIPDSHEYLRGWYYELARARSIGMNGPNPLSYEMIESWSRLTDQYPEPHEVEALFAIDAAMLAAGRPEKTKQEAAS